MRHLVLGLVMAFLLVSNQAAASGAGPVAYLSNTAGPTVFAVDTSSSAPQLTPIPGGLVGTTTYGVAVGPKGAKCASCSPQVYVTGGGFQSGTLTIIDTALLPQPQAVTSVPVGRFPRGVAVNHDGSRVYVANALTRTNQPGTVSVIDAVTNTVVTEVTGFSGLPFGVAASPVGNELYVTTVGGNYSVLKVDTLTNRIVAGVPDLGGAAGGVVVSPDGTRLYVTDYQSGPIGRVWVIDTTVPVGTTLMAVVATVPVGRWPFGVDVTPDGKWVFVSNSGGNTVSVVDTTAVSSGVSSPITVQVGNMPQGVSVSSDGSTVYVANFISGNLTAVSVATKMPRTISPSGGPLGGLFPIAFGHFVTPLTVITVNFDVVPKVINPKAQGTIPVKIYGSKSFDVHTIDLSLLRLNGMVVQTKPNGEFMANYGDFTGSGYDDVMVHFSTDSLQAQSGDANMTLTGQTMCSPLPCSGTPIQGTATVTFIH